MMPSRTRFALLIATACGALVFSCPPVVAQIQPANPSFSAVVDKDLLAHDFGTYRQGATGATFNFSVTNRPAPIGTTSPMSLAGTDMLGDSAAMTLQTGAVSGLPAGGQAPLQLVLTTNQYGNLQVSYVLSFGSDALPSSPLQNTVISAYAKVLPGGDYDNDGDVDGADYVLWRNTQGQSVSPGTGADGDFNGQVNSADYTVWRSHFGQALAVGAGFASSDGLLGAGSAVPEPSSLAFLLTGLALLRMSFRSR